MTDIQANSQVEDRHKAKVGLFVQAERRRDARQPATARATMITLVLFVAAGLVFAAVTPLRELVRASGTIVPTGRSIAIEHLNGGIVADVFVSEGERVKKGDLLAILDSPELTRNVARARDSLAHVEHRLAGTLGLLSLMNFGTGESPHFLEMDTTLVENDHADARQALFVERQRVLQSQIEQATIMIETLENARDIAVQRAHGQEDQVSRFSNLAQQGHVSAFTLIAAEDRLGELRGELASAEVALARAVGQQATDIAKLKDNELAHGEALLKEAYDLREQQETLKTELKGLLTQIDALSIRAPRGGVIQSVAFPMTGEVIGPDTELFELFPDAATLVAEVQVEPKDIGHISVGDSVSLKLQTFDFRRYGGTSGVIESLSPTSVTQTDGATFYRAVVSLDDSHVGSDEDKRRIQIGMEAAAEIQTNSRTILQYMLKPLDSSLRAILTER
ncbi:HlyD family type I secretion periplasmic adaptor subunit [Rhodobacteraceae bacterium SC52]|nr:HlyD family type I secretion periplasmic adaptor subunit [Rhodobacteraceae bacterium SC52]